MTATNNQSIAFMAKVTEMEPARVRTVHRALQKFGLVPKGKPGVSAHVTPGSLASLLIGLLSDKVSEAPMAVDLLGDLPLLASRRVALEMVEDYRKIGKIADNEAFIARCIAKIDEQTLDPAATVKVPSMSFKTMLVLLILRCTEFGDPLKTITSIHEIRVHRDFSRAVISRTDADEMVFCDDASPPKVPYTPIHAELSISGRVLATLGHLLDTDPIELEWADKRLRPVAKISA